MRQLERNGLCLLASALLITLFAFDLVASDRYTGALDDEGNVTRADDVKAAQASYDPESGAASATDMSRNEDTNVPIDGEDYQSGVYIDEEGNSRSFFGDLIGGKTGKVFDGITRAISGAVSAVSPVLGGALEGVAAAANQVGHAINGSTPAEQQKHLPQGQVQQTQQVFPQPMIQPIAAAPIQSSAAAPYVQIVYQGEGVPQVPPFSAKPSAAASGGDCYATLRKYKQRIKMLKKKLRRMTKRAKKYGNRDGGKGDKEKEFNLEVLN